MPCNARGTNKVLQSGWAREGAPAAPQKTPGLANPDSAVAQCGSRCSQTCPQSTGCKVQGAATLLNRKGHTPYACSCIVWHRTRCLRLHRRRAAMRVACPPAHSAGKGTPDFRNPLPFVFHGVHLALERMSRVIDDLDARTPGVGMVPSCGQAHEKSPHGSRCDVSHVSNPDSPPASSFAPVSPGALCIPLLDELRDVLAMLLQRHLQLSLNLWARREAGGRAGPAGSAAATAINAWEHRHCRALA